MASNVSRIRPTGGKSYRDEIKSNYAWPRPEWKPGKVYHSPFLNIAYVMDEHDEKQFFPFRDAGDVLVERVLGTPTWSDLTGGTPGGYKLDENIYSYDELIKAAQEIIAGSFPQNLSENYVNYLNNWAQHYSTPDINFMDNYIIPIRSVKTIDEFKATSFDIIKRVVLEMVKDWSLNNVELLVMHTRTMQTDIPGIAWRRGSVPNEEEDDNEVYDKCCAIQKLALCLENYNYMNDPASANLRHAPDSKEYKDAFRKWKFEYDKHRTLWTQPNEESVLLFMWNECDLDMKYDVTDPSTKKVEWKCCAGSYTGNKLDKANAARRKGKAAQNPSYTNLCLNYSTGDTVSLAGQNMSFDPFQGPDDNYQDIPAIMIHKFEAEVFADKLGKKLNSLAPIKIEACMQDFRNYLGSLPLGQILTPAEIKNNTYAFQLLGVTPPAVTSLDEPQGIQPSAQPTMQPSAQPSMQPSAQPTSTPIQQPSNVPTAATMTTPTQPTAQPAAQPVAQPVGMGSMAMPTATPVGAAQ